MGTFLGDINISTEPEFFKISKASPKNRLFIDMEITGILELSAL